MPSERKAKIIVAVLLLITMVPLGIYIMMGGLIPKFDLPYHISMNEISNKVYSYPTDGVEVPLFDDFRSNTFTMELPKVKINLQSEGPRPAYGEFQFFLSIRDKELKSAIEVRQSEIIDMIQRTIEQVRVKDLESPEGKERLKKAIRHKVNAFLEGNIVLKVYYQSVLIQK